MVRNSDIKKILKELNGLKNDRYIYHLIVYAVMFAAGVGIIVYYFMFYKK
jgi:hypothetical protein